VFLQRLLFIACSFLEQAKHTQHTRTQHIMAFLASKSKTNNRSNSCNRVVVVVVSILPIMVVMFLMSKLPSSRALQTNLRVVTPRAIMDHTRTSIRFMTIKHFDTTTTPTTTPTNPIPDDSNINNNNNDTIEEISKHDALLEWEKPFDFSDSPKWDSRFNTNADDKLHTMELTEEVLTEETRQDEWMATEQRRRQEVLYGLSPTLVRRCIQILSPYVADARREKITTVLQQRTCHTQFLFENPSNPSNVWACLRTMDSFGIQHVHIVTESKLYQGKAALLQKQGMRTAMGSAQWLSIHHYVSTEDAVQTIRAQNNCRILASDLNPNSVDIRDIDWNTFGENDADVTHDEKDDKDKDDAPPRPSHQEDRPLCIVMGNELRGISDTMRNLVDGTFTLPMVGFAESFNLSVATAITLAHLSAASASAAGAGGAGGGHTNNDGDKPSGPLRPGDLDPDELNALILRGMVHSISQTKVTKSLLKREGIVLPDSIYQKGINLGKKIKE